MEDLKLTIDLLPKGAWGNDLSSTLSKKDWDKLRSFCYERFDNKCAICGENSTKLNAHEIWEFDIKNKTQKLVDIVALCPKCHGVKHFRNSERLGYGENAKRHFMQVNNCKEIDFANHYTKQQFRFEELNEIYRWKIIADLKRFGGEGIEVKQRYLPMITNPYEDVSWHIAEQEKIFEKELFGSGEFPYVLPKIRFIDIDNYAGIITFVADYVNKIELCAGNKIIAKKFNISGKFVAKFSVEDIKENSVYFKIHNKNGMCCYTISVLMKLVNMLIFNDLCSD